MANGKVLIIEDETEVADLLAFNLRKAGFDVAVANDGLTGCRMVQPEKPRLILLDLMLPDLEGWEICRMIRGHPEKAVAATPIILLTALAGEQDRLRGLELGADDYLTKPFSMREVVLRIERLIHSKGRVEELQGRVHFLEDEVRNTRELYSFVNHEIRNKMLVIGGLSNRLANRPPEVTEQQLTRYAETIRDNSEYLSLLAEQVLLLRQMESENGLGFPCEFIPLQPVLEQVVELHRVYARDRDITLALLPGASQQAFVSSNGLRICLSNLVENALKYCPSGSTVEVSVTGDQTETVVTVNDNGKGIPHPEKGRVFERFYRGRDARHHSPGNGLGLYIVRTLTEAMGGKISLESEVGRGTRVRLTFHATQQQWASTVASRASHPGPISLVSNG